MPNWIKDFAHTYGKAIAAVLLVVITAVQAALSDGHLTKVEDVQIVISGATAVGVWLVPIHPEWAWTKTALAVLLGVLNVAVTLIVAGWVSSDWTALILAALTAGGVGLAPAESKPALPAAPGQ